MHLTVLKTSLSYIDIQPSGWGKSVHFFPRAIFLGSLSYSYPFFPLSCQEISVLLRMDIHCSSYINFPVCLPVDQRHESVPAVYRHLLTAFSAKRISFPITDSVHTNISKTFISFVNFKRFMQPLRSQGCYEVPEEKNSREDRISHRESLFTSKGAVPGRGVWEAAHHFQSEFLRQGLQSWLI